MNNKKKYASIYDSILGKIIIESYEEAITDIWFDDNDEITKNNNQYSFEEIPILEETRKWLDDYFSGMIPKGIPKVYMEGTEFQIAVWKIISKIPYGKIITYKDIADEIVKQRGSGKMSAQAVGGAVGKNPIPIIIPCHRVIGTKNKLTGYGCGIERKIHLLEIEKHEISSFKL